MDNGGEYKSGQFDEYPKSEGVRHQLTVPKSPEQNGVAERCNRTLVEMTRAMVFGKWSTEKSVGRNPVYSSLSQKSQSNQSCERDDTI